MERALENGQWTVYQPGSGYTDLRVRFIVVTPRGGDPTAAVASVILHTIFSQLDGRKKRTDESAAAA